MPGLLSNDSSIYLKRQKKKEKHGLLFFFFLGKHYTLSYNFCLNCATFCSFTLVACLASLKARHHGLKRDHWHLKLSVVSKQFSSLSLPSIVPLALSPAPSAPGWPCHRQQLIGALRPFTHISFLPHLPAFAAISPTQLHT